MSWFEHALDETVDWSNYESLETFRSHIDAEWIEQALAVTGTATLRRRKLPAEQVIWLVLGMALCRNQPIGTVVSRLDLVLPEHCGSTEIASSAVTQARQRLGAAPMRWLFETSGTKWARESASELDWRGLSLFAIDGTTLRIADSDENREHFGLASGGNRGLSGYPLVRIAALLAVRSHLLLAAEFGPYAQSEHALCESLWCQIPDHSLTIVDRNFLAAKLLLNLESQGNNRNWLTRAKTTTKWKILASFGRYDKLVELNVSSEARRKTPSLPESFTARAISYCPSGAKTRQWLLTSLRDSKSYPAQEVIALYHERWEIELAYDELKTHMLEAKETIRSRTVECVAQELWGILLTYNLIRLEMQAIAHEAGVAPVRISFLEALRFIRTEWEWCALASPGAVPKKLRDMRLCIRRYILPPRRSKRRFPRAVKIKMSNYPKKPRTTTGDA